MSNFNSNEQFFKDALSNFESPYAAEEMSADWSSVQSALPATGAAGSGFFSSIVSKIVISLSSVVLIGSAVVYTMQDSQETPEVNSPTEITSEPVEHQMTKIQPTITDTESASASLENDKLNRNRVNGNIKGQNGNGQTSESKVFGSNGPVNNPPKQTGEPMAAIATFTCSDEKICSGESITIRDENGSNDDYLVHQYNGVQLVKTEYFKNSISLLQRETGNYTIKIANAITGKNLWTCQFQVVQAPRADFSWTNGNKSLSLINRSSSATAYDWKVNDTILPADNLSNIRFASKTTISLVAYNAGCSDTLTKVLHPETVLNQQNRLNFPNAFTPNGDGVNDILVLGDESMDKFSLRITDRNGMVVFESLNKNIHWNGTMQKSGNACLSGTYFYFIRYTTVSDPNNYQVSQGTIYLSR